MEEHTDIRSVNNIATSAERQMVTRPERDFTQCWKMVRWGGISLKDGRSAAELRVPESMYFGEHATVAELIPTLRVLDESYQFAAHDPQMWRRLTNPLRLSIIHTLTEATRVAYPELDQHLDVDTKQGRKSRMTIAFSPERDAIELQERIEASLSVLHTVYEQELGGSDDVGDSPVSQDTFLDAYHRWLSAAVDGQQIRGDHQEARRRLNESLPGGRVANYENWLVPRAAVFHDEWTSEHFYGDSIKPRVYFSAGVSAQHGWADYDKSAYDQIAAGVDIAISNKYRDTDTDLSQIQIESPPGVTNGYFIQLPVSVERFEKGRYKTNWLRCIYVEPSHIGRIHPESIAQMGDTTVLVTRSKDGNIYPLIPRYPIDSEEFSRHIRTSQRVFATYPAEGFAGAADKDNIMFQNPLT